MTNTITEITGYVTLRGHRIEVQSEIGHRFAEDAVRFIEGIATEEQLRKKYQLDDTAWQALETNEPLQLLVGRLREERLRNGSAQREKSALRWNSAIDVVDAIVQDPTASAKHRLDGARELRACAVGTAEDKPDARSRFQITINFGSHRLERNVELTPVKHDEGDELEAPRPSGIVNYARGWIMSATFNPFARHMEESSDQAGPSAEATAVEEKPAARTSGNPFTGYQSKKQWKLVRKEEPPAQKLLNFLQHD
jgi:hypothetical protein